MTQAEEIMRADDLRNMLQVSRGYKYLESHIDELIKEGWEQFIELPAEKKTGKAAYQYQAKYQVLRDLKEWINESIKQGDQASEYLKRQKEKEALTATILKETGTRYASEQWG